MLWEESPFLPCDWLLDMGCGSSGRFGKRDGMATPEALEQYLKLEKDIAREEKSAPAPTLSHAMSRLEALTNEVEAARLKQPKQTSNSAARPGSSDDTLRDIIFDLGIDKNATLAAEHEEFIANINRQALAQYEVLLLTRRMEEADEEIKLLTSKVNFLQGLYQEQDTLLGGLFGDSYGSGRERELELELDKLRSYRDTLAGGELQWKEAVTNVNRATDLMDRAVECWKHLSTQTAETRFHLATEARNSIQEAALCVQMAQSLLPGVQFPYCTPREVMSVLQAVVYMFSDIHIPDRHSHAGKCYISFSERAKALAKWMDETIQGSLGKDLNEVERKVQELSEQLRRLRVSLIRKKSTNAENWKSYPVPDSLSVHDIQDVDNDRIITSAFKRRLNHDNLFGAANNLVIPNNIRNHNDSTKILQKQLQKSIQAARGPMWPSRRIEELQLNYMHGNHQ